MTFSEADDKGHRPEPSHLSLSLCKSPVCSKDTIENDMSSVKDEFFWKACEATIQE
jgi:hypothetical protein